MGIDLTLLREVFSTGATSRVLETDGADMQKRDHECYFSAEHAAKDSGIALALAENQGLQLPPCESDLRTVSPPRRDREGGLDKSAVAELTFLGRS